MRVGLLMFDVQTPPWTASGHPAQIPVALNGAVVTAAVEAQLGAATRVDQGNKNVI
jgi:hypothetical protein